MFAPLFGRTGWRRAYPDPVPPRLELRGRVETWEDEAGTYIQIVLRGLQSRCVEFDSLWVRWHVDAANDRPRPSPVRRG